MNHKKWIRLVCIVLALLLSVTGSGVCFAMAEQPEKGTVLTEEQAATPETAESAELSLQKSPSQPHLHAVLAPPCRSFSPTFTH